MVSLKYLSNVWRTLGMTLINREINLDLNWSKKCVVVATNTDQGTTLLITDTKRYVPVLTLLTQDNTKLLEILKSSFKRTNISQKNQQKDQINI